MTDPRTSPLPRLKGRTKRRIPATCDRPASGHREVYDPDHNLIRRGMAVVCDGDVWVAGYVSDELTRLDREKESIYAGRNRLRSIHVIGYQIPLVIR